jgi:predicted nucleic acid-binding protein
MSTSSALIKRAIVERESARLEAVIEHHVQEHALLVSSTSAWVEVGRAIRARFDMKFLEVAAHVERALAGVAERPMNVEVASLARRLNPNVLRSLDAIHLASVLLVDADVLLTYDTRLSSACEQNGLRCEMPGDEG